MTDKNCIECNGTGIFYFTNENKLKDSQPCGRCNTEGWIKLYQAEKQKFQQLVTEIERINNFHINEINRNYNLNPEIDTKNNQLIHLILQQILDKTKERTK